MKSWAINILLVTAVFSAIYFFTVKFEKPTDQDRLNTGLAGIDKYLAPGSHITFKTNAPFSALNMLYINYFLGPVKLEQGGMNNCDTMLLLLQPNMTDTATVALIRRSSILWLHSDNQYHYILLHHS